MTITSNYNFSFSITCSKDFVNGVFLVDYCRSTENEQDDLKEDLKLAYCNRSAYVEFKLHSLHYLFWHLWNLTTFD